MKRITLNPIAIALLLAAGLFVLGGLLQPDANNAERAINIMRLAAALAIIAAGQTLVIISGGEGIDLSVGAVVTLGAILVFRVANGANGMLLPALALALLAGATIGAVNGAGIVLLGVPPLVMTLGMTGVVTGLILAITQGQLVGATAPLLGALIDRPVLLGIPGVVLLTLALGGLMWLLLERTSYGKQVFAIGANRTTARLSGVNVAGVVVATYALSGLLAALGGAVLLGSTQNVFLNLGARYTLPSIAAVVVGGTLIAGGVGSYWGTMAGALVLTILTSLLTTLNLPESTRQIVYGLTLLALLALYGRGRGLRQ
ncbi:MAG TPA: ABC transporter permease [Herpetosiphonaceae bacterium]|nr:ABC transporter permease [Herpetosiphonaceae bacterium]